MTFTIDILKDGEDFPMRLLNMGLELRGSTGEIIGSLTGRRRVLCSFQGAGGGNIAVKFDGESLEFDASIKESGWSGLSAGDVCNFMVRQSTESPLMAPAHAP